jgi:transcriptional regulator with XRE-family HTH domain
MNGEQNNFAKNLKLLRHLKGMTLLDLEQKTGIGQKVLSKYETGRTDITVGRVFAIADALGVKVGTLITADITLLAEIRE